MTTPSPTVSPYSADAAAWQDRQKIAEAQAATAKAYLPTVTPSVTKDTVTTGATQTGLAGALAQFDAEHVAEDIAAITIGYLPHAPTGPKVTTIRIVGDLAALSDIATHNVITAQLTQLQAQVDQFLAPKPNRDTAADDSHRKNLFGPEAVSGAANAAVTAVNLATALLSSSYQYGGASIAPSSVAGLDLLLGHMLQRRGCPESIVVDRLQPPAATSVQLALSRLLLRATAITAAVEADRAHTAWATSRAKDAEEEVVRLDSQIEKLAEKAESIDSYAKQRSGATERAANAAAAAAAAQAHGDAGRDLATAITTFAAAVQASTATGPAPLIAAAHGEILSQPGTIILYAKVVAAGDDVELKSRLIDTKWYSVTAVSAEYAIFDTRGTVLTAGVRTVLQSGSGSLHSGLSDLKLARIQPPSVTDKLPIGRPFVVAPPTPTPSPEA